MCQSAAKLQMCLFRRQNARPRPIQEMIPNKNRTGRFARRPDSGLVRSSKVLLSFIKLHPKSMSTGRPGRLQSGRNLCSKLWRNLSLPMSTGISKEHSRNLWRHRWMSNRQLVSIRMHKYAWRMDVYMSGWTSYPARWAYMWYSMLQMRQCCN